MEKLNIAELLKDCPKGMELNCTMYDNLHFDFVNADYYGIINCYTLIDGVKTSINFTKYGTFNNYPGAKCVIYPKGKTTWEGFQRPFKDGDIISNNKYIAIFHKTDKPENCVSSNVVYYHCWYNPKHIYNDFKAKIDYGIGFIEEYRLATEEEKEKLFNAIKDNGYKWNEETKTLEKLVEPKFKVGDRIRHKLTNKDDVYEINSVYDDSYGLVGFTWMIYMKYQDQFELVPNKFDINTLKPFDKVLVRCSSLEKWHIQFFEKYNTELGAKYPFICLCNSKYCQCIPYEGNEHLLGTSDDCDEYFKNW